MPTSNTGRFRLRTIRPRISAFELKSGVCQDFAQVMIGCMRAIGLPARYVSGYLRNDPPPGQVKLIGADASHAWVSVYCPGERLDRSRSDE